MIEFHELMSDLVLPAFGVFMAVLSFFLLRLVKQIDILTAGNQQLNLTVAKLVVQVEHLQKINNV